MVVNKCDLVGQGEADLQLDENMINQAKKELKRIKRIIQHEMAFQDGYYKNNIGR